MMSLAGLTGQINVFDTLRKGIEINGYGTVGRELVRLVNLEIQKLQQYLFQFGTETEIKNGVKIREIGAVDISGTGILMLVPIWVNISEVSVSVSIEDIDEFRLRQKEELMEKAWSVEVAKTLTEPTRDAIMRGAIFPREGR